MQKKPSKIMRMLNKLFPTACSAGQRRLRRYAHYRSLKQAWAAASRDDRLSAMAAMGMKNARSYTCFCNDAACSLSRPEAASNPPAQPPASLVKRYKAA